MNILSIVSPGPIPDVARLFSRTIVLFHVLFGHTRVSSQSQLMIFSIKSRGM